MYIVCIMFVQRFEPWGGRILISHQYYYYLFHAERLVCLRQQSFKSIIFTQCFIAVGSEGRATKGNKKALTQTQVDPHIEACLYL